MVKWRFIQPTDKLLTEPHAPMPFSDVGKRVLIKSTNKPGKIVDHTMNWVVVEVDGNFLLGEGDAAMNDLKINAKQGGKRRRTRRTRKRSTRRR